MLLVERSPMHWYDYLSYFFGGAFLANSLPHLINGVSGRSFQAPFAKPPGKGLSSPTVNVLWGFINLRRLPVCGQSSWRFGFNIRSML